MKEGWLLFQRGKHESAIRLLEKAKQVLSGVGDHRNLGFIAASRGRIAKREGSYGLALDFFGEAFPQAARERILEVAFSTAGLGTQCRAGVEARNELRAHSLA
jgi:tetratricopeptide (TPR) repeat protein